VSTKDRTINQGAREMLEIADQEAITTAFSRAEGMRPCPIGRGGACCAVCFAGPCRVLGRPGEELVGVCGARPATIAARNLARGISAGAAAHSDHGRDLAFTLLAAAKAIGLTIPRPVLLRVDRVTE